MKKIIWLTVALMIVLGSCAPSAGWKTRQGKKKLKNYNMHMNDNYKVQKSQMKQMKKRTRNKH